MPTLVRVLTNKRKYIEQNFDSVAWVMSQGWDLGVLGVQNLSVGICDGAPSTAHSSLCFFLRLLCLCVRLFICALWSPAGKGLASLLSFVVCNYEFVTFPVVSLVRCGT